MKTCLLLLYLAGLWGDTLTLTKECVQELLVDRDFTGDDVLQIYSPDVAHCQTACTQHHLCLFFSFLRPDWKTDNRQFYCYLKHTTSGTPSRIVNLKGVTSGYSLRHCGDDHSKVCLSQVYQDVDFPEADFIALFTDTYKQCQQACTKEPGCQFFTFCTNDFDPPQYRNKCHLKYSRTLPTPPTVKVLKGVVSGFSRRLCSLYGPNAECQSEILKNTDFPGNDFEQVHVPSPEHCRILCNDHPKCTFFSFSTGNYDTSEDRYKMLCWLKHNTIERPSISKAEIMSGFPTRFCDPSNVCTLQRYENVDFLGYDRQYVIRNSATECEETCSADPDCQFYTYIYSTFHDPSYRNRCYLKQVITIPSPPKVIAKRSVVSGFHLRTCKKPSEEDKLPGVLPEAGTCGLAHKHKEKVVGGSEAEAGSWPWQASLQLKDSRGEDMHLCGASIINPRWVVTAAHCLKGSNPSSYSVVTGMIKLSEAKESHEVEKIVKHQGFNDNTFENDIALFKLKTPVEYSETQQPICLASTQKEEGFWSQSCWVTGWGKITTGELPNALQQAQVPLIKPDACASLMPGSRLYGTMLCAGYKSGGVDTCQGDSGGPLVCQADGKWYLTGITSWGDGCGEAEKPGVYARVASFTDWILSSVNG
ncbi:plasma kallikrein-like [Scleropages formosus]|uniref:plasma kallikrein-like n=1 Tax=Scleropages formosus TaxID=113540 RepID=UPI0010FA6F26|nr:plasma kallikrein-like [Scleropages formosus]